MKSRFEKNYRVIEGAKILSMAESELRQRLTEAMKTAMREKQKDRLEVIRLINAAIKQREVDERIEITDDIVLQVLDKMAKQRRESISQFKDANRQDLVDKEEAQLITIQEFMPKQLDDAEIAQLIDSAVSETGACGMKDMGKVMGVLKPKLQGRADMSKVSAIIKSRLAG